MFSNNSILNGKIALVTGSGRGIGKAIAKRLAESGASIVINDIDENVLAQTIEEFRNDGLSVVGFKADVSQFKQVKNLFNDVISKYKKIDILINNAGIYLRKPFEFIEENEWDTVYSVNNKGSFFCCKEAIPYMKNNSISSNCKIINISSIVAIVPRLEQSIYCSSKAAIIQWSKVLALELAQFRINVNVICPGLTDTELIKPTLRANEKSFNKWLRSIPMRKLATPLDHANLALFLCSSESDHITGQVFCVDGGQSINYTHGF